MKRLSMLIIEDTAISRSILVNIFQNEYEITEASDGREAWDMLSNGLHVDIILLDMLMPVMSGGEFLRKLRSKAAFARIPVIANSQQDSKADEIRALELGADDFVSKPYNPQILKIRVRNLTVKYVVERKKMEGELQDTTQRLDTLINTVPGGIAIFEVGKTVVCVYHNEGLLRMLGYGLQEKLGSGDCMQYVFQKDREKLIQAVKGLQKESDCVQETIRIIRQDGTYVWAGLTAQLLQVNQNLKRLQVIFMDLTKEKMIQNKLEESYRELEYRVERDVLTGIYNKEIFYKKTRELLNHAEKSERFVIAVWNVDRFKVINDLFGSSVGDAILIEFAGWLQKIMEGVGSYGRLEADHFASCCNVDYFEQMQRIVRKLLEHGIQGNIIAYPVMIHMGLYEVEDSSIDVERMCDRANMALQSIKDDAIIRYGYYEENMRSVLLDEQNVINEMNHALQERQFYVQLQPIVDSETEKTISAEALVRWKHPMKGNIYPSLFIPIFEKNGFITKLDMYVWEEVCRILSDNQKRGIENVPVSINVSRMNFYRTDLCEVLSELTRKYGIDPSFLKVEITESAYTDNAQQLISVIHKLHESGFKVLMDDFGSGFSSLNMLKDVPVDILKIDMKFVDNVETSERGCNILYSVINMAHALNMQTVAEGVETKNQYEMLRSLGCDSIQGYYFSKPLPIEEFESRLESAEEVQSVGEDGRPVVLVVDDEEAIRVMMRLSLEGSYQVLEAADGVEALEILKRDFMKICLVLTDIMMPRMDGMELLQEIHSSTILTPIPVMVITSCGEKENAIQALEYGAVDVIQKPMEPEIVLRRIQNIIKLNGNERLSAEIHALRESNVLQQNLSFLVNGKMAGLCKIKADLETGQRTLLFVNEKFMQDHCIAKGEEYRITQEEYIFSCIQGTDRKEMQENFQKTVQNKTDFLQNVYLLRQRDGSLKKILASLHFEYTKSEYYMEVLECEVVAKEYFIKEKVLEEFAKELLYDTSLDVWTYHIDKDEIYYTKKGMMDRTQTIRLEHARDMIMGDEKFSLEDRRTLVELHNRVRAGEKKVSEIFFCEKLNQEENWWNQISYTSILDHNGIARFAIGISEDITIQMHRKESGWKDEKYKELVKRDCYLFAEIDLTENKFLSFHSIDMTYAVNEEMGTYEKFEQKFIAGRVHPDEVTYSQHMLDRSQLLFWYGDGEREVTFDFRLLEKGKDTYEWYSSRMYFMTREEGNHVYIAWQIRNIHREKIRMERILSMAEHDPLTGLYNRNAFTKLIETCFEQNESSRYRSAFIMMDIDNFKNVNDSFGHEFGDNVLKTVASQIKTIFRKEDYVGRLGGDEFAVFLPRIAAKEVAIKKAAELCSKTQMSFDNCGNRVSVSCSAGIAFAPEAGMDFKTLYEHADAAQYEAKRNGKNQYRVYAREG